MGWIIQLSAYSHRSCEAFSRASARVAASGRLKGSPYPTGRCSCGVAGSFLRAVLSGGALRTMGGVAARFGGRALAAASLFEAAAEALHQVDDFGLARFGHRLEGDFLAFDLALDEPHQVLAVLVGVFRRIPFGREAVYERLRHVELRLAHAVARRKVELADVDELVGESHHGQDNRVLDHFDGRKMLRIAEDELGDADAPRFPDRITEQRVGAFAALCRHEIIRGFEKSIVDRLGLDEVDDVDRARLFERGGLKVLLRHHDEVALLVFEPLDQILPGHRLAVAHAYALELPRRLVFRVQHAELRSVIANRRMQFDWDIHQPERDRSLPKRSPHTCPSYL